VLIYYVRNQDLIYLLYNKKKNINLQIIGMFVLVCANMIFFYFNRIMGATEHARLGTPKNDLITFF